MGAAVVGGLEGAGSILAAGAAAASAAGFVRVHSPGTLHSDRSRGNDCFPVRRPAVCRPQSLLHTADRAAAHPFLCGVDSPHGISPGAAALPGTHVVRQ
ncbi:unnamed protein product [Closterium sp. NIES-54]